MDGASQETKFLREGVFVESFEASWPHDCEASVLASSEARHLVVAWALFAESSKANCTSTASIGANLGVMWRFEQEASLVE